jgi:hypothetical protein
MEARVKGRRFEEELQLCFITVNDSGCRLISCTKKRGPFYTLTETLFFGSTPAITLSSIGHSKLTTSFAHLLKIIKSIHQSVSCTVQRVCKMHPQRFASCRSCYIRKRLEETSVCSHSQPQQTPCTWQREDCLAPRAVLSMLPAPSHMPNVRRAFPLS